MVSVCFVLGSPTRFYLKLLCYLYIFIYICIYIYIYIFIFFIFFFPLSGPHLAHGRRRMWRSSSRFMSHMPEVVCTDVRSMWLYGCMFVWVYEYMGVSDTFEWLCPRVVVVREQLSVFVQKKYGD